MDDSVNDADVAIIGFACRFPGAKNIEQFWENLRQGVESITFFQPGELVVSGLSTQVSCIVSWTCF
jgi:acyl transferase domain-containing protein